MQFFPSAQGRHQSHWYLDQPRHVQVLSPARAETAPGQFLTINFELRSDRKSYFS